MPARVFNQDPAGDAGRRAAAAGLSVSACPYPIGNWLGDRWRASWLDEMARIGRLEHRGFETPEITPGVSPYSMEETESVLAMLARNRDASYIAKVLNRPIRSVEVKIGSMNMERAAWTPPQDRDLLDRARRADHPGLKQIAAELGRTVHAVGSRLAHHGGLKMLRATSMARAAE
jgi:hypothetical protein